MSETTQEPRLPNSSQANDNRTLNDSNSTDAMLSNNAKTGEVGACGDSALGKDSDSVSVTSDSPSEKKGGAKSSGIKPPSKISRPCAGAHKPGLPVSPPKSK